MLNDLLRKVDREKAGIADPFELHRKHPLAEHLVDFKNYLTNKGSTHDYVKTTTHRVDTVNKSCKFDRIDQISASRVQQLHAELREGGKSIAVVPRV